MVRSNCLTCKVEFNYHPSQSTGKYCSNRCQNVFQRNNKVLNGTAKFNQVRLYFLENSEYKCIMCGVGKVWNNMPLTLQLDHIDGDRNNNKLENLRWLCPNCHTQTGTWGVKNASEHGRMRLNVHCR